MHAQIADNLDISTILGRALAKVRGLRGGEAQAQGLVFLCIALLAAIGAWRFDLQPTIEWMGDGPAYLTSTLPGQVAILVPFLTALIFLSPTLLGIGLPRLVPVFKFAELAHLFVMIFDATTDYPNVQATMAALWPRFESMGPLLGGGWWYLTYALLWAMATEGFELLLIVCVVCGVVCLYNGRGGAVQGGRP